MNDIKKVFVPALVFLLFILGGCVTRGDMETIQRDTNNSTKELLALQRNLYDLNAEMKNLSSKIDGLNKKNSDLQQQIGTLSTETKSKFGFYEKELESSNQPMRRYQADLGARLDKLQLDVQSLTGRFEESKYFAEKTFGETKNLRENYQAKIDELDKKMAALSSSLDSLEKRPAAPEKEARVTSKPEGDDEQTAGKSETARTAHAKRSDKAEAKPAASSADEAYKKAYDLYAKGDLEGARGGFQKFLESHGKSKLAENAHFWLGECFYSEKKFDEAILEYDEVIKRFPKGSKVPDALFRQGMAFLEMKDTVNAKLILKEVIKRFPKSDQATRARKKLKEIA